MLFNYYELISGKLKLFSKKRFFIYVFKNNLPGSHKTSAAAYKYDSLAQPSCLLKNQLTFPEPKVPVIHFHI